MLDCPKCSARVDGLECLRCGYKEASTDADGAGFVEVEAGSYKPPERLRVRQCANWERGQRCGRPGTLSETTRADKDTEWWCAEHFPAFRARQYRQRLPNPQPADLRPVRAVLARLPREAA